LRNRASKGGIVIAVMNDSAGQVPSALTLQLRATAESVGTARRAVSAYCAALGAERSVTDRVALSVSEAVTNALVHAYRHVEEPAHERIELEARHDDASLIVIVRDFGCGMSPRLDSPGLGLGLPLIAASTSSVQIDTPAEGGCTEISMAFDL
jgi:serine/threonine-protein kinase RsbW